MEKEKYLHIVSFDNPFPPVYGGTIDVFYKLKALHSLGYKVIFHFFTDIIPVETSVLNSLTEKLYFYKRKQKGLKLLSKAPFSVASRFDETLIANLNRDDFPILFEGLQSSYAVAKHDFGSRKIFLRLMNIESNYYRGLFKSESNFVKKALFAVEVLKYKLYQPIISRFDAVFTLSKFETDYVQETYKNAVYVPVFHGNSRVSELSGFGKYAFYHGDLRMADNRKAALFLIEVFKNIPDYNLIIASNHAKKLIEKQIQKLDNISHSEIRSQEHLDELLRNSHINVMLSFQESGTKLKVVNSLFKGRFCITNKNMIDDEKVKSLCSVAETKSEFIKAINFLKDQEYHGYTKKVSVLEEMMNDTKNAMKIDMIIQKSLQS